MELRGKKIGTLALGVALCLTMMALPGHVHAADLPGADESGIINLENGDYTLTEDITSQIKVAEGVTATLNLNGHNITTTGKSAINNSGTLTVTGSGTVSSNQIGVANTPNGTMTLKGGTIVSTSNSNYSVKNLGTMTIEDPTEIKQGASNKASVVANGWYSGTDTIDGVGYAAERGKANLTMNGGTVTGNNNSVSTGLKNDDYGTLTVNGGTVSAPAAFAIVNHNVAEINGGDISGNTAIYQSNFSTEADNDEMTINGGTFTSTDGKNIFKDGLSDGMGSSAGAINIKGGDFKSPVMHPTEHTAVVVEGGDFVNDITDPASGIQSDATIAKITEPDGSEEYVAGKEAVEEAAQDAAAVEIEQGDADIPTVYGIPVTNHGEGNVTLGGKTVGADDTEELEEPEEPEQPVDPEEPEDKTEPTQNGDSVAPAGGTTTPAAATGTTVKAPAKKTTGPNTGDNMNGALWVAILAACGIALGLVVRKQTEK